MASGLAECIPTVAWKTLRMLRVFTTGRPRVATRHVSCSARTIRPIPKCRLPNRVVFAQTISVFGTKPHALATSSASWGIDATRQRKSTALSAIGGRGQRQISAIAERR